MAKYSFELKKKVVESYLNGEGGKRFLAKKYGVSSVSLILKWVTAYQQYGTEGLLRSRKNEIYPFDFKFHIVELYLTTEVSYQELAVQVGMNNPSLIAKWVNDFQIAGSDALKSKRKRRCSEVKKATGNNYSRIENTSTNPEYLKQLEEENLRLKIENAYLKELRRLRLEGTPQNKKRESSTVSEDHLN